MLLEPPLIQLQYRPATQGRLGANAKIGQHEIEKLHFAEPRVEHEGCGYAFLTRPLQELVEDRRLTRAHLSRKQDEALARLDSVDQTREGLRDVPREIKVSRIGLYIETVFGGGV